MYAEDDLLPISALQHLLFCERQCALIHVEQQWADNRLTVEGQHLHRRADRGGLESRGGSRTVRSVRLRSLHLGLTGVADVVEFGPRVFPVEYKRGRPKADDCDRVQLCAQALCLEEMLGSPINDGALFYGKTRRRELVRFDARLRGITRAAALRLHELLRAGETPPAARAPKCRRCSLRDVCMPGVTRRSVEHYLDAVFNEAGT